MTFVLPSMSWLTLQNLLDFGPQLLVTRGAVASEYHRAPTVNDYFGTQGKQPVVLYRAAISVLRQSTSPAPVDFKKLTHCSRGERGSI